MESDEGSNFENLFGGKFADNVKETEARIKRDRRSGQSEWHRRGAQRSDVLNMRVSPELKMLARAIAEKLGGKTSMADVIHEAVAQMAKANKVTLP